MSATPLPPDDADAPRAASELWGRALAPLEARCQPEEVRTYLRAAAPTWFDGHLFVLEVPTPHHRSWFIQRFLDDLYAVLRELHRDAKIIVEVHVASEGQLPFGAWDDAAAPRAGAPGRRETRAALRAPLAARRADATPDPSAPPAPAPGPQFTRTVSPSSGVRTTFQLNPRYTFEQFVIGENNRFAHAAAMKVADATTRQFNPLFIYGGAGLGKTHLMQAIGHRTLQLDPSKRVVYVTSEQFMNHFITALSTGEQMEFRSLYRNVDLLLVDDVQFFVGKEQTQAEFFYTFNELYETGRKIVFSSDKPPKDLMPLEDRLRSRFEWGLTVDIQVPDVETRAAILKKKSDHLGIPLDHEVALFIAERIQTNVRELEGALQRVAAYAELQGRHVIDLDIASDVLGHIATLPDTPREVTVESVQLATCNFFSISLGELIGPSRVKKLSRPRHIAQYLARQLTGLSFPEIGDSFGGRDHTSILHACRKIERELDHDAQLANCITFLTRQLRNGDLPPGRG